METLQWEHTTRCWMNKATGKGVVSPRLQTVPIRHAAGAETAVRATHAVVDLREVEVTEPETLGLVEVHRTHLAQVISNLISNAVDSMADRETSDTLGRILRVSTNFNDSKGRPGVQICVEDNGGGVPEELQEQIFKPFFTTKGVGEGTGRLRPCGSRRGLSCSSCRCPAGCRVPN